MTDASVPEAGMVYWLDATLVGTGDGDGWRPAVVLTAPATATGTVTVVARSTIDHFGVAHPAGGVLGFSSPGCFSRRHPVLRPLWTSDTVTPIGPLDHDVFSAVVARFGV